MQQSVELTLPAEDLRQIRNRERLHYKEANPGLSCMAVFLILKMRHYAVEMIQLLRLLKVHYWLKYTNRVNKHSYGKAVIGMFVSIRYMPVDINHGIGTMIRIYSNQKHGQCKLTNNEKDEMY